MTADVEVIVLCKNEGSALRDCLTAVLEQQFAGSFSVTLIDSGSTDGSVELARSFGARVIEIVASEFQHARTRNLGAERTQAPVIVYTNGHTVPADRLWLERLTAPLRDGKHEDLAGVYGRQLPRPDANPMERFMVGWFFGYEARVQRAVPGQPLWREQTLFSTVNCAIRRALWAERPFSDRVDVSEDQEWSRSWLQRGYTILYEPAAAVIHSHNEPIGRAFRRAYDTGAASAGSYLPRERGAMTRFTRSNLKRLAEEAAFLTREGNVRWLPYGMLYEAARIAGWALGRQRIRVHKQL